MYAIRSYYGTMMGPSGGCFAIRNKFYKPVPSNFLVDDFYINMKILEQGYKTINNTEAIVYEDVSNNLNDEFKRKVRISRITSYNVCYTKLLRKNLLSVRLFQRGDESLLDS